MGNSAIWFSSRVLPSDASVRLMSGASASTLTDVRHTRNLQANGYGGGSVDHERDLRRQIRGKTTCRCFQPIVARRHIQELVES